MVFQAGFGFSKHTVFAHPKIKFPDKSQTKLTGKIILFISLFILSSHFRSLQGALLIEYRKKFRARQGFHLGKRYYFAPLSFTQH